MNNFFTNFLLNIVQSGKEMLARSKKLAAYLGYFLGFYFKLCIKMRRSKEDVEQTRNSIIETAIRLFDERGYQDTRIAHIAQEAGLTRGAVYWHFKDKKEILTALVQTYLSNDVSKLEMLINDNYTWSQTAEAFSDFIASLPLVPARLHFARIFFMRKEQIINTELSEVNLIFQKYQLLCQDHLGKLIDKAIENSEINRAYNSNFVMLYLQSLMAGVICLFTNTAEFNHISEYAKDIIIQAFRFLSYAPNEQVLPA